MTDRDLLPLTSHAFDHLAWDHEVSEITAGRDLEGTKHRDIYVTSVTDSENQACHRRTSVNKPFLILLNSFWSLLAFVAVALGALAGHPTHPRIMLNDSAESKVAAPGKRVTVSLPALMMSASTVSSVG